MPERIAEAVAGGKPFTLEVGALVRDIRPNA
jgi:hypothetical protein